jgi:uncharacterized RmlC-like cupin family protein
VPHRDERRAFWDNRAVSECRVVRAGEETSSRGPAFGAGISAESAGATRLCMHLGVVPPGGTADPHLHEGHESAIYVLEGHAGMDYGNSLEHRLEAGPGDFVFVPAGVPHRPFNLSETEPVRYVVARTDPDEDESVVLLPHLR